MHVSGLAWIACLFAEHIDGRMTWSHVQSLPLKCLLYMSFPSLPPFQGAGAAGEAARRGRNNDLRDDAFLVG